jgi:hypothetical protein
MGEAEPSEANELAGDHEADSRMSEPPRYSRRDAWLGALLVVLVCGVLIEARLWRPGTCFGSPGEEGNVQIMEALAWWKGQLNLDVSERPWDTVRLDGKYYSHFPPMFTLVSAVLVPLFGGVPHWFVVLAIALPVPLLGYWLFLRRTGSPVWGGVLAIGLVCGTSAFPVLDKTIRGATSYHTNQMLAVIGLLILLWDYFGRRRVWPAAIGLTVAVWSRQLTIAYAVPLVFLAYAGVKGRVRLGRLAIAVCTLAVIVGLVFTLNALKFRSPFESGYGLIYQGRDDPLAQEAQTYGVFSPRFVPRNLYYANLGFPRMQRITMAGEEQIHFRPNKMGTGIWWTTPLLIWLFVDLRRILRDAWQWVPLLAVCILYAVLMCFHGTGYEQRGFNRFSLDYIPVLLALIAPYCVQGWRKWLSLAMVGWSVLYFRVLI